MDIGALFDRVSLGFVAVAAVITIIVCVTPVGSAPASVEGAPAVSVHVEKAAASQERADRAARPAPQPKHRHKAKDAKSATPDLPEVSNAAGEPLDVTGACEENLAIAAKQGLRLPDGWDIQCVGPGLDWSGNSHWGVTCPYDSCPEGAGPYVSISNPTYYVIAHELCHANFGNDELMADACAAEHGASLETSPYQ
jgi:hypothetical protein